MSSVLGARASEAPYLILDTLAASGWAISITGQPEPGELTVRATKRHKPDLVVEETGADVASVALVVATRCARVERELQQEIASP